MDLELLASLRTREGSDALAAAAEVAGGDPLAAASALRSRGIAAPLAAAALTQTDLRRRAEGKFGAGAAEMFFTRPGFEQATRAAVADRRAARLRAAGVETLADLGCGLGSDALAAARRGIRVYAVDADPLTAAVARANTEAAGLAGLVTVECADATSVEVERFDAVFADPARRRAGRGRVMDPQAWSPPWDFIAALPARVPRTVLKLAPGIDHALLPPGAEGEWVSVDGDLVEAAFWCGPLAEVPRRASLLPSGAGLHGSGVEAAPVGPVGRFLYDPDPAVVRSHLVAEFAAGIGGRLADPEIAYVHSDEPVETPYARRLEITDVLPFSLKRLRALLRERGVGRAEIRKRGSALEPEQLRRDLKLRGPASASIVLTRVAGAPTVLLCR
ncbi:methyltransferase [Actinoplanes sp. NBRC 14428]|uniref:Methyltransferase family protein n=1 Tax=Pseudosporangium ferrugineum TaxID=439699 RepID=A0A2T0RDI2_9ACTN|nr:class I SAM-dependent methyltransferase [Pseudosporangium ferrugineum]PRY19225.1 methyltransferase family protein [Pseudosporangium ferrugineum]BCJ52297.1 methyltransferase [Actinoplanes sp. NBRC 14428]